MNLALLNLLGRVCIESFDDKKWLFCRFVNLLDSLYCFNCRCF